MKQRLLLASAYVLALAGCAATGESSAVRADDKAAAAPAQAPEMQLPPGWTAEDMQACMEAGTPGPMQAHLAESAGVWKGESSMWMAPGMEPVKSTCTATITPLMDGRYVKNEIAGDVPGMGPFSGLGLYGYDNVSKMFVATWCDSMSTGFWNGLGTLSADGKTLEWTYSYNCPIKKSTAQATEVEKITGPNSKTLDMFMTDPKTGVRFQTMHIEFTRAAH